MSYHPSPYMNFPSFDKDVIDSIHSRLNQDPELANALWMLTYKFMEANTGDRFTRYAKKDLRDRIVSEAHASKHADAHPDKPADKAPEAAPKKRHLQLSKPIDQIQEFTPKVLTNYPPASTTAAEANVPAKPSAPAPAPAPVQLDSHQKIADFFVKYQQAVRPNPNLEQFRDNPIIDLAKRPFIEETQPKRPRIPSFHKH